MIKVPVDWPEQVGGPKWQFDLEYGSYWREVQPGVIQLLSLPIYPGKPTLEETFAAGYRTLQVVKRNWHVSDTPPDDRSPDAR